MAYQDERLKKIDKAISEGGAELSLGCSPPMQIGRRSMIKAYSTSPPNNWETSLPLT
jgi:hypothetical protein